MSDYTRTKRIRDAVHGDIEFTDLEFGIVNTRQYQRMRGIRQLGLAHLVFPSAQHTRFEHSLGVAHMAQEIIDAVRRNGGDRISLEQEAFIRALALLHDVGHVSFGHTLEDERPVFPEAHHHDGPNRLALLLKDTELGEAVGRLAGSTGRPNVLADIIRVMEATHEKGGEEKLDPADRLCAYIVGNTVCADLLDYLKRDPYFTGIQHRYDERIIAQFDVRPEDRKIFLDLDDEGSLRNSVASEILHLLRLRYTLGERVYYHKTKAAASAMISKAVELANLDHTHLVSLRDEELLWLMEHPDAAGKCLGIEIANPVPVTRLISQLRSRRLFEAPYTITRHTVGHHIDKLVETYHEYENLEKRRLAETELCKAIGAKLGQVIIYCPQKGMAKKPAMVQVKWPGRPDLIALEKVSETRSTVDDETLRLEIEQLKRKHESLWKMHVFLDPDLSERATELRAYCEELFGLPDSYHYRNHALISIRLRRGIDAIVSDPAPETIDVSKCGPLFASLTQADMGIRDIQNSLPRRAPESLSQKRDGDAAAAGSDGRGSRGAVTDPLIELKRILIKHKYTKSDQEDFQRKLGEHVGQFLNLSGDERSQVYQFFHERLATASEFGEKRATIDALVAFVVDAMRRARTNEA